MEQDDISSCVTLQMKATEQYVLATLCILLHKKLPTFESVGEILTNASDHSNDTFMWYCLLCCKNRFQLCGLGMKSSFLTLQIKATEHYFSAVLVILLHKMLP